MALFYFHIADSKEFDEPVEAANTNEAVNVAFNVLHQFSCRHFPPPERLAITVFDEQRSHAATLRLTFQIEYAHTLLA